MQHGGMGHGGGIKGGLKHIGEKVFGTDKQHHQPYH